MLDAFYGYFFGSEDVNGNNTKENVTMLTNSAELVACTLPSGSLETKDDDWILLDGQLSSGRSTPVIVPEPDLIAIDDEVSTVVTESLQSLSSASTLPHNGLLSQEPVRCDCIWDLSRRSRNGISGKHTEQMRRAKQKAVERKELEQKLFENQLLGMNSDADKKHPNNITNNKTLNMLNNAAKMKRSTAAGHFAADSKTKPRSKKTGRLLAGRNNDRKVNTLN